MYLKPEWLLVLAEVKIPGKVTTDQGQMIIGVVHIQWH